MKCKEFEKNIPEEEAVERLLKFIEEDRKQLLVVNFVTLRVVVRNNF